MIKKSEPVPAPVSFEKTKYLIIISITLVLVLLFSFGFRQGFAIFGQDVSIVREISYIGETDSIENFLVLLHIESNKYLIGIKEFLPENSKVISYSLDNSYDIFEFKESENAWLIGDSSKKVNADLSYILEADSTDELNGEVLYSLNENIESAEISGDSSLCFFQICMEKEIIAGDFYPIVFNAGNGFLSTAWISRIDGRSGGSTIEICDSSECFGQQKVYAFFPDGFVDGEYKLQVYDSANEQWIEFLFSVIGGRDLNIPVTECSKLNESGNYILQNDILGISDTCFTITADDVVLDGNGYTIDCDDLGVDYGIYAKAKKNIIIKNLIVTDFYHGIYFDSVTNSFINNLAVNSNKLGIYLYSSSNNALTNIVSDNNTWDGLWVESSSYNTFTNIETNNNSYGISLYDDSSNNILTNIISNNNIVCCYEGGGLAVTLNSNNNILTNITTNENFNGIYLGSLNNIFIDIKANSNKGCGIKIIHGLNNTFKNIFANSNRDMGISLESSLDSQIIDTKSCGNIEEDFYCSSSSRTSGTGNKFTNVQACADSWPVLGVNYENC